jgi:hypothetical protein
LRAYAANIRQRKSSEKGLGIDFFYRRAVANYTLPILAALG